MCFKLLNVGFHKLVITTMQIQMDVKQNTYPNVWCNDSAYVLRVVNPLDDL